MQKKLKKRHVNNCCKVLAGILAIQTMFGNLCLTSVQAAEADNAPAYETRLNSLIEAKISEEEYYHSQINNGEEVSLSLGDVKVLHDFSGGEYTLAELEPCGYIILHNDSGVFVEDSSDSVSPYIGLYGDGLYYAGPTNYYYEDGDNLYNTVWYDENLSYEDANSLKEEYSEVKDNLESNPDEEVVAYLNGTQSQLPESVCVDETPAPSSSLYNGYHCVSNYQYFVNLDGCGNNVDGTCSYVAAAILLGYYKYCNPSSNCIPSSYLTYNGSIPSLSNNLHLELVQIGKSLGYGNGLFVSYLKNVVSQYLTSRGMTSQQHYLPTSSDVQFVVEYLQKDFPVIWSGNIINYGSINGSLTTSDMYHSIVVYGYNDAAESATGRYTAYYFISHFGWHGYNTVRFAGTMYSGNNGAYTFKP